MNAATREYVRNRAQLRCEYCLFPDHALELPFHVEHIIASVHRSDDDTANLAWACPRCNLRKGPNLTTIDSATGEMVALYNPRNMTWIEHFIIADGHVLGITSIGRGTARLLGMNDENRLAHRRRLMELGVF
jgi:hypothetical protein